MRVVSKELLHPATIGSKCGPHDGLVSLLVAHQGAQKASTLSRSSVIPEVDEHFPRG